MEIDLVLKVRDISHLSHGDIVLVTSDDDNKGGEYVSFYLEYEFESELGRVSHCVCTCVSV